MEKLAITLAALLGSARVVTDWWTQDEHGAWVEAALPCPALP
jgi:hypothetical protein